MSTDHQLHLVAPFSPTIMKATIPPHLVDRLNARTDAIHERADDAVARDWSQHLAGVVRHEIRFTDVIREMEEFRDFVYDIARIYAYRCENALLHFTDYPDTETLRDTRLKIAIKEGWVNDMHAGDYNPVHFHQGCHFSTTGFLSLPPGYDAELAADKAQQNTAGCLQFIDSRSALGVKNLFTVKPAVGDLYLWPSWMLHCVYPFRSPGVRRSIAINLALE